MGDSKNAMHWEITETPRAAFYHQLNRNLRQLHDGDITKWFRDLVLINKPPTESIHCWRDVDGQPHCHGHAGLLELYISIPIMLIIELGDQGDSENIWTFPKHIRPLTQNAETTDGVVYDIVGRAFFSDASQHFIARFTPNTKDIYNYDGMTNDGRAILNSGARVQTHLAGSAVHQPVGYRSHAVVYHLRGGLKAQARYTTDQVAAAQRLHSVLHFTPGDDGCLPTASISGPNIVRFPAEDRYWRKNPHTNKSSEYEFRLAVSSNSKKRQSRSSSPESPQKLTKAQKRVHLHVDSSDDDELTVHVGKRGNVRISESPIEADIGGELSQESAYSFECRCDAVGDGRALSDGQEVIQCDDCRNWSHVACQRDARASNLRTTKKFKCDNCSPLPKHSKPVRRYLT